MGGRDAMGLMGGSLEGENVLATLIPRWNLVAPKKIPNPQAKPRGKLD